MAAVALVALPMALPKLLAMQPTSGTSQSGINGIKPLIHIPAYVCKVVWYSTIKDMGEGDGTQEYIRMLNIVCAYSDVVTDNMWVPLYPEYPEGTHKIALTDYTHECIGPTPGGNAECRDLYYPPDPPRPTPRSTYPTVWE